LHLEWSREAVGAAASTRAFRGNRTVRLTDQGDQRADLRPQRRGDPTAISLLGIAMLLITFAVVLGVNRIPTFGSNASTRLKN
jgi:hypothetical protein